MRAAATVDWCAAAATIADGSAAAPPSHIPHHQIFWGSPCDHRRPAVALGAVGGLGSRGSSLNPVTFSISLAIMRQLPFDWRLCGMSRVNCKRGFDAGSRSVFSQAVAQFRCIVVRMDGISASARNASRGVVRSWPVTNRSALFWHASNMSTLDAASHGCHTVPQLFSTLRIV